MPDIFLSYAKEDLARARTLAESLQSVGWSVWWDRRLRPGEDFAKVIGTRLQEARCVIVLWSKISVNSGWVRDEASEALKRNVLIPLLIDVVEPPLGFRAIQTGDLRGWRGDVSDSIFRQLIADLVPMLGDPAKAVLASRSTVLPPMPPSVESANSSKLAPALGAWRRRWIALSGIGATMVGAILWAGLAYIARIDRKPGESATQEQSKVAKQLPERGAERKTRLDPNAVAAKEFVPKRDKKEAEVARYRKMDFGYNGCSAKFGELLTGVNEEEMIRRASAANSSGFTFHPSLGYGRLLLEEYPEDCRSPSNMSWPLYLRSMQVEKRPVGPQVSPESQPSEKSVAGTVPGGVPGGYASGVLGANVTPQRIRVGGLVQAANLIRKITPVYPPLAKQARIQGVVRFTAVIGKDGAIQNLQLVSGHPLLVEAARQAVTQWQYKTTLLNGEPVEVVTQIDVNFTLSQETPAANH